MRPGGDPEVRGPGGDSFGPHPNHTESKFLKRKGSLKMLWTIAVILLLLWVMGVVTAYTMSGFIHILLIAAIVVVLVRVIQGRRIV
jgi:hypothetical protein